jgi:hypothetical protein
VTVEAVLGVLLAVTINVATGGGLPDALSPLRPWAWPLVAVLGVLAMAVPLGRFVIERTRSPGGRYSAFHRDRQRGRILAALAQRWVEGTLTPSHAVTPKIGVTLAQRADAVDPPADLLAPPEPLGPAEVGIREVFERLDRSMLLLGGPGAGKSMLMLELAVTLVAEAHNEGGPRSSSSSRGGNPHVATPTIPRGSWQAGAGGKWRPWAFRGSSPLPGSTRTSSCFFSTGSTRCPRAGAPVSSTCLAGRRRDAARSRL